MGVKHVLTVPGRYEEIQKICQFVAAGAAESGLDETAIFHIELACDEACTNIIEHAYEGEDKGDINISWQFKGSTFTISFHDNGRSFNPQAVLKPTLPPTSSNPETPPNLDNVKVGGLGIHFMRQLMDDVQFQFDDEAGNTLILVKKKA
jgi:serine/threonine-protein kinase RsbW